MVRKVALLLAALVLALPAHPKADEEPVSTEGNFSKEPLAKEYSLERGVRYLDRVALKWTNEKKCGSCHTNYAYLMTRPAVKEVESPEVEQVRSFFQGRVAGWDKDDKDAKPKYPAEVVSTAAALAMSDAEISGKLQPITREALDRMWTIQKADGAWDWVKCNWAPFELDDYYGAIVAAVAVGYAPENYKDAESAKVGIAKLKSYLAKTPAPDMHHKTFLLWASTKLEGLMDSPTQAQTVKDLLALQRADGGWNLPSLGEWKRHDGSDNDKNGESDGYATGLAVFVLHEAGMKSDSEPIRRGLDWLKTHQRQSGRWFTRSLNDEETHYITHAGTGFALRAIAACKVD